MRFILQIIAGPDKGRTFELVAATPLLVGRSQTTQTRLSDPRASRVHCEVSMEGGIVLLKDSSSACGTFVNGQRVTQQELKPGDIIQVGDTQLQLSSPDIENQPTVTATPKSKPKLNLSPDALARLPGQTLGRYEIGPMVAPGRTGVVFKALDTKDSQTVALKVLNPEFAERDEDVQRFMRAVKTMLPLRHPNLVSLLGAGKTSGYLWMAMEYVDGESLTQVIGRIGIAGMLDWRHGLRVGIHIGRALDFAHRQQIIHRNIAPPNIILRQSDKVAKLGDLMFAKALEGALAQPITQPGALIGDISYMSPERTRGDDKVDGRSDIYSLGATIYALLTGRPPFAGGALVELISKIRQEEPQKPTKFQLSIPGQFEGAVLKMLAKRPENRYQSAAELLIDLERAAKLQGAAL